MTDKVNPGLTGAHHNFCKPAYNKGWEQTLINSHYQFLCQAAMSEVKSQINVICLKNLAANIEKNTDVIVAGRRSDATEHVIFFGGDVQVLSILYSNGIVKQLSYSNRNGNATFYQLVLKSSVPNNQII